MVGKMKLSLRSFAIAGWLTALLICVLGAYDPGETTPHAVVSGAGGFTVTGGFNEITWDQVEVNEGGVTVNLNPTGVGASQAFLVPSDGLYSVEWSIELLNSGAGSLMNIGVTNNVTGHWSTGSWFTAYEPQQGHRVLNGSRIMRINAGQGVSLGIAHNGSVQFNATDNRVWFAITKISD